MEHVSFIFVFEGNKTQDFEVYSYYMNPSFGLLVFNPRECRVPDIERTSAPKHFEIYTRSCKPSYKRDIFWGLPLGTQI